MWRHTMALFHSPRFDIVRRRRCISWKTLDHGQPHDITLDCIAHNVQIIKCTKRLNYINSNHGQRFFCVWQRIGCLGLE